MGPQGRKVRGRFEVGEGAVAARESFFQFGEGVFFVAESHLCERQSARSPLSPKSRTRTRLTISPAPQRPRAWDEFLAMIAARFV